MKVFIWQELDQVSPNWHPNGGLVVVAEDYEHALDLAAADEYVKVDKPPAVEIEVAPDDGAVPSVFVFPNAGCC